MKISKFFNSTSGYVFIAALGLTAFWFLFGGKNRLVTIQLGRQTKIAKADCPPCPKANAENDPTEGLVPPLKLVAESAEKSVVLVDAKGVCREYHCCQGPFQAFAWSISNTYKPGDVVLE